MVSNESSMLNGKEVGYGFKMPIPGSNVSHLAAGRRYEGKTSIGTMIFQELYPNPLVLTSETF